MHSEYDYIGWPALVSMVRWMQTVEVVIVVIEMVSIQVRCSMPPCMDKFGRVATMQPLRMLAMLLPTPPPIQLYLCRPCMDSMRMELLMLVHMQSMVIADWQWPVGIGRRDIVVVVLLLLLELLLLLRMLPSVVVLSRMKSAKTYFVSQEEHARISPARTLVCLVHCVHVRCIHFWLKCVWTREPMLWCSTLYYYCIYVRLSLFDSEHRDVIDCLPLAVWPHIEWTFVAESDSVCMLI